MRAVDLFCGAGGLSLGLEAAGAEVACGVELNRTYLESFAKAHPGAAAWAGDVAEEALVGRVAGLRPDLVCGGPPCQPFSTGGKARGGADPRAGFNAFHAAVRRVRPVAFLVENVPGALRFPEWAAFADALGALGYVTTQAVLDAADYGTPQHRRRVFLCGIAHGHAAYGRFIFPKPTHGPHGTHPHVPAGAVLGPMAIGDANRCQVTYARQPDLRPSPYDGHLYNGGGRPIDLDRPAPTLLASMGGNKTPWVDTEGTAVHYHAHLRRGGAPREGTVPGARRITVAEAAMLQGFPYGHAFCGTPASQYAQVGNAVPPPLAEAVAHQLVAQVVAR